jgi:hypothetical protein
VINSAASRLTGRRLAAAFQTNDKVQLNEYRFVVAANGRDRSTLTLGASSRPLGSKI